MSERDAKESYEVERRVMRGMDIDTDLSLLQEDLFRETKNLTINGGVHETRPGSTRYGSCTFAGIVGEQHGMTFISTIQGEWCLAHIGSGLYAAIKDSGAAPTRIVSLTGSNIEVSDSNHPSRQPFVQIQLEFDTGGFRIYKIMFRSSGSIVIIEYKEATGVWVGRDPGIPILPRSTFDSMRPGEASRVGTPFPPQLAGTYRIRVRFVRVVNGVRLIESPVFAYDGDAGDITHRGYVEHTLTSPDNVMLITFYYLNGIPAAATHFLIECTRVLNLVGDGFSDNGNDPTIFYECANQLNTGIALSTSPLISIADATVSADQYQTFLDASNLQVPTQDTANYLPIPPHNVSAFEGGLVFFVGSAQNRSRIFIAGSSGISTQAELYNPAVFVSADEADGKTITAMELVGNHLGIWKENKTGILMNRDFLSPVVWRDRKIGASAQGCVSMLTQNQAIVLCHDGILRVFNGSNYDQGFEIGDEVPELSSPVAPLSERIQPETASFIWHREKLHLLHGLLGHRRALVLHAREGYGWTPWEDLTHHVNALAENELKWIFMDEDTGFLYEQSPLDPVYLDRDKDQIQWSRHDGPLWPKNRRNSMVVEDCFIEGVFDMLTEAHFELDEQRVEGAAVGISPAAGVKASRLQRWFKAWAEAGAELRCNSLELFLEGIGYSLHRAVQYRIIEESSLGVPSVPAVRADIFTFIPSWGAPVVHYARFDRDSEEQYDFSGHRRNLAFYPGLGGAALRSHIADMPPYGGESLVPNGEVDSGWISGSWDGMDYLGDEDGACSKPQTFEAVLSRTSGDAAFLEDAANANGTWQIVIQEDGSIRIRLFTYGTTPKRWEWVTAAGVIPIGSPLAPYVIQASLSSDGDALRLWAGAASASVALVPTTRAALAADSGYVGDRTLARGSGIYLSHYRRLARIRSELEAKIFHNLIKGLL
jgi:hypothetical protein